MLNATAYRVWSYCLLELQAQHLSYHEGIKFNISNYSVILVELLGLAVICKKTTHSMFWFKVIKFINQPQHWNHWQMRGTTIIMVEQCNFLLGYFGSRHSSQLFLCQEPPTSAVHPHFNGITEVKEPRRARGPTETWICTVISGDKFQEIQL